MTRDNDGDWVPVVRHPDGTMGVRMTNRLSDVAIAAGLPIRNFEKRPPACQLKIGPTKIEGEREFTPLAGEIFVELAKIGSEGWSRLAQLRGMGIKFHHARLEFEPYQTFIGSSEKEWPNRRG